MRSEFNTGIGMNTLCILLLIINQARGQLQCEQGYFRNVNNVCTACQCQEGPAACNTDGQCVYGNCAAGYTNFPYCQTECAQGTFGLRCEKSCNCPPGDTCSPVNGLCSGGVCKRGYFAPSCQTELPLIYNAPTVRQTSTRELTVTWDRWSAATGSGQGPVSSYLLESNEDERGFWTAVATVPEDLSKIEHNYILQDLEESVSYTFRVTAALNLGGTSVMSVASPASEPAVLGYSEPSAANIPSSSGGTSNEQVTSITLSSRTTTSLSIQWTLGYGTNANNVQYQIIVSLEESHTISQFSPSTYTSQRTSFDITSLYPASKYRISVAALQSTAAPKIESFWTVQGELPEPRASRLVSVTDTTLTADVYSLDYNRGPISNYMIVVEDITSRDYLRSARENEINLVGYLDATRLRLNYYVTMQIAPQLMRDGGNRIILGDSTSSSQGITNYPLRREHKYVVWNFVVSDLDGSVKQSYSRSDKYALTGNGLYGYNESPSSNSPSSPGSNYPRASTRSSSTEEEDRITLIVIILLVVFGVLLLLCCIGGLYVYMVNEERRENYLYGDVLSYHKGPNMFERMQHTKTGREEVSFSTSTPLKNSYGDFQSLDHFESFDKVPEVPKMVRFTSDSQLLDLYSRAIPVKGLGRYYAENTSLINSEFRQLPSETGDVSNAVVANQIENKHLNRSQKIFAYDSNRIQLKTSSSTDVDSQGQYINASKVKSHTHKFYIVTQAPMTDTINNFWTMVYQQQVDTIVTLIDMDFPPNSKEACPQYWPDVDAGEVYYDDIAVKQIAFTVLAHYTIRWFELSALNQDETETFNVAHFQYSSWLNSGIPHHPIAFWWFVARIRDFHQPTANLLVHCQLGTGRSGMFVAIDSLLDEGRTTEMVDIVRAVSTLRQERPGLVRTLGQYNFIHEVLIEAFHHRDTRIEAVKFRFTYDNILSINASEQDRSIMASEYDIVLLSLNEPGLCKTYKWTDFSPYVSPHLPPMVNPRSLPHTAKLKDPNVQLLVSQCDSHTRKDIFIVTMYPNGLECINQFWEMVFENNCRCIVMINDTDEDQLPYWPSQDGTITGSRVMVKCTSTQYDITNSYMMRNIEVMETKRGKPKNSTKLNVRHFQYINWPGINDAPMVEEMLDFTQQVMLENSAPEALSPPVIVHSAKGVSRGALFCILWTVIERLQEEAVIDIYRTTRYTRSFLNAAVTNLGQYRFLFLAVREVLDRMKQEGIFVSSPALQMPGRVGFILPPEKPRNRNLPTEMPILEPLPTEYRQSTPYSNPPSLYANSPYDYNLSGIPRISEIPVLDPMHNAYPQVGYTMSPSLQPTPQAYDPYYENTYQSHQPYNPARAPEQPAEIRIYPRLSKLQQEDSSQNDSHDSFSSAIHEQDSSNIQQKISWDENEQDKKKRYGNSQQNVPNKHVNFGQDETNRRENNREKAPPVKYSSDPNLNRKVSVTEEVLVFYDENNINQNNNNRNQLMNELKTVIASKSFTK